MPAPDLETIFDIETAIETAAKTVLEVDDIAGFTQRETEELTVPRVDIRLQLGAETGHKGIVTKLPLQHAADAWDAVLDFMITTARYKPDHPNYDPTEHGRIRAKVRLAAQYFKDRFTAELLPYHVLTQIAHRATQPSLNIADDEDISAVSFAVKISVRDGAWPAA